MKLTFNLNYHTHWGEALYICGDLPCMGSGDPMKAAPMELGYPDSWRYSVHVDDCDTDFNFFFIVKAEGRPWRFEWGTPHRFEGGKNLRQADIFCNWNDMPADKPFYSSAFTEGMLHRQLRDQPLKATPGNLHIRVSAPLVGPDEILAISGEGDLLGNWDPRMAVRMNDAHYPVWEANLPLACLKVPFEYKFVVLDRKSLQPRRWESCSNRRYGIVTENASQLVVLDSLRFAEGNPDWKGAGTAIPVFSLRSEEDYGVGDFQDLKKMIDWAAATGQKIIQLLPVNDTTKDGTHCDSYPYSANSAFALHPMYIRPDQAGTLKDPKRRKYFRQEAERLNALPEVDYVAANALKQEYMRELFAEQWDKTSARKEYKTFAKENSSWLDPYAAWCVLRDINHTPDNSLWKEFARYDANAVEGFLKTHRTEADYYCFVQYHLDRQLREIRDYAHQNGIVLKGDIPIGIGRHSVDAWQAPELFNMDMQAGAPPDDFSVLGQNWGFPTYNWERMAADGFEWWKRRFRKMSDFFDAYRIDHILGFFRIWQVPMDAVHGLLGFFNPALPFSAEEIRDRYGFHLDRHLHTHPYIQDWMLQDFFGDKTEKAKAEYLESDNMGGYRLKPFIANQRLVERHFAALEKTDENRIMCETLMGLIDDVLFIEDPYEKGKYHPRISAQFTYQYRALDDYAKNCFNRLYNDFFYRRNDEFWHGKAMWKLPPLLDATGMLTCAEDLGMIPACVPDVMRRLEILSLEIQRMPKNPGHKFGDTWHYPYYSVCTTSTHDMAGIRAWWENDRSLAADYYYNVLHEGGDVPCFAEPWICQRILELHLQSPSMFCIIPLQDWLSADGQLRRQDPREEQINEPSDPHHYWRYRMHLTLESLLSADDFNNTLRAKIAASGR